MMTRLNRLFSGLALCFTLFSCNRQLSTQEYIRFLSSEKCALYSDKVIDRIRFKCRLQTPELIALLHSGHSAATQTAFEEEKKKYKDQLNVVFLIEDEAPKYHQVKKTVSDKQLYGNLLAYANTGLQQDFSLQLQTGELIPCGLVHMEAANSIQPVIRVTLSFNGVDPGVKDYSLIFDDNLFHTGRMKFHYGQEVFSGLPTLKLKS